MKVSSAEEYAIRAMSFLAREYGNNKAFSLNQISEQEKLPLPFLEQIFRQLKLKKLVLARRGVSGGYVLARDPAEVSSLEVIEAVSGPVMLHQCKDMKFCKPDGCDVSPLWLRLTASVREVMRETKLRDIA